ncbi:MAG: SPFH domain-containing protein [Nostochopsis sp.]
MKLQKLPSYLVTLAGVVILGAVCFSVNQRTQAFTAEQALQVPLRKSLDTQKRQLAIAPLSGSSTLTLFAVISGQMVIGIVAIIIVGSVIMGVFLWSGLTQIGEDEVGIVYRKFGRPHSSNRLIALDGEVGYQAKTLAPGWHWCKWSWMYEIRKDDAIHIAPNEIGLIEAKDGATLPPGNNFGKFVECDNFQDAGAFIKEGGQRGKQLAILTEGIYWINTELFNVEKREVIRIHPNQVGLVEAKDGATLPPGRTFGKVVDCNNFQDAQAFINEGGQRGKQLAILTTGIYKINTEFFKIQRVSCIHIDADKVGLLRAKDGATLPPGQTFGKITECNNFQDAQVFINEGGQRGKQLAILTTGIYQINTDLFEVCIVPQIKVPGGEIALVIAQDGASLPSEQILGKVVECNNFQDAQAFIENGGQKGKQLAILGAGIYQINTDLFTIITTANATEYGLKAEELKVYKVEKNKIGIVTTLDGDPIPEGEIAGLVIEGHNKFQDAQKFIDAGGYRGLQEEFLQEGSWNLNPWFLQVEQVPLTEISSDKVGVIISYIGKNIDSSSTNGSRYQLVNEGYKGVQKKPLRAGKYAINTRVKSVEIVPTNEIILDWSDEQKPAENYDANLKTLKLRSKDAFIFDIGVTQVISIAEEDAPTMILRVGSQLAEISKLENTNFFQARKNTAIKNLVTRVLGPMIDSYFRNSAQGYEALDFLENRIEIQRGAEEHIKAALNAYGVQAISTLIKEIDLPDKLEELLKQRKLLEEQRKNYEEEELTEQQRQSLIEQHERTKAQADLVKAEQKLKIAEINAQAELKKAKSEAEAQQIKNHVELDKIRQESEIEIYRHRQIKDIDVNEFIKIVETLSPDIYARLESDKAWSDALAKLKIDTPEIYIGGGNSSSAGGDVLQASTLQMAWMDMLRDFLRQRDSAKQINMSQQAGVLKASPPDDYWK